MKIVAMMVSTFITAFSWFETSDRCASSRLDDAVLEEQRLVHEPDQVVVHVTEADRPSAPK